MTRTPPLAFVVLDDRIVPASLSVPWPDAGHLTLSFAPDGTATGGAPSSLFRTLDAASPTPEWQEEVLRAFQTWAVAANVNVGLVPDDGLPFGTLGLKQGDPRFGDVRVGAFPMAADVLAVTDPYDPFVANTTVGDVFLNSTYRFGVGDAPDLFSVVLHEAGHVFGLAHSPDPGSPMYEHFHGVQTGPTAADIAALRAIYGPRPPDAFEGRTGNDTLATATALSPTGPDGRPAPAEVVADVSTPRDADVYRLVVPEGATGLDVRVRVAGISLLVPRLTVYDAGGRAVATATATGPLDNDLSIPLDRVQAGDTYYVRVGAGRTDVFGVGAYRLEADPRLPAAVPERYPVAPPGPPGGATLLATTPGYVEHTYYEAAGALTADSPARVYRVRSADIGPGLTNVMTVAVRSGGEDGPPVRAAISDDQGKPVAARVIVDRGGQFAVQVPGVGSDRDYLVRVFADNLGDDDAAGYEVAVDFAQDASHLQPFVDDTLGAADTETAHTLRVVQSQQFHFALSATDWGAAEGTGVRMTIIDAGGRTAFATAVTGGATRTADVFLNAGEYTVRFTRTANAEPLTPVLFRLGGIALSEPIGPQLRDTTLQPVDPPAARTADLATFYWLPATRPAAPLRTDTPARDRVVGVTRFFPPTSAEVHGSPTWLTVSRVGQWQPATTQSGVNLLPTEPAGGWGRPLAWSYDFALLGPEGERTVAATSWLSPIDMRTRLIERAPTARASGDPDGQAFAEPADQPVPADAALFVTDAAGQEEPDRSPGGFRRGALAAGGFAVCFGLLVARGSDLRPRFRRWLAASRTGTGRKPPACCD